MVLVRTDYDSITHYMFHWSAPVIETAEKKGFDVVSIDGRNAVKKGIISRMEKIRPDFTFLNGHGDARSFYGDDNKKAISMNEAHVFDGSVAFVRACNCLEELGKKAVNKHASKCFIGYKDKFWNVWRSEKLSNPLQDDVSRPIMEASNAVPLGLIKGADVEESINMSHDVSAREIEKAIFSPDPASSAVLRALVFNDTSLDYHGNEKARIA